MIEEQTTRPGWQQFLRRCPHCGQVWLLFAARENDEQICKACGVSFPVRDRDSARPAASDAADDEDAQPAARIALGGTPFAR
jgi:uncharacterized protein (DUF983 family)